MIKIFLNIFLIIIFIDKKNCTHKDAKATIKMAILTKYKDYNVK